MPIAPIDYTTQVAKPFESAVQGFNVALGMQDLAQKRQDAETARLAQQQMQSDLAGLASKQNPTGADYAAIMTRYPQLSEHFKRGWDVLSADRQATALNQASQVYAALQGGRPDVASQFLKDQAAAHRNSGNERDAKAADTMAQWIEMDPNSAKTAVGLRVSSAMGPEKFATTFEALGKERRSDEAAPGERQKTAAEEANLRSQVAERANRLAFDKDKAYSDYLVKIEEFKQKNNQLPDSAIKLVNDATMASVSAEHGAASLIDLAGRLEAEGGGYGAAGKAAEWMARATGRQDALTGLRQEYVRLRASNIGKNLPPGAASDKDIALAMSGYPPETANAAHLGSFLRGMAKLQQLDSAQESAKAEWVNAVGHLGRPKTDIEVMGVKVPAGSQFTDFSRQFVQKAAQNLGKTQAAAQAGSAVAGRGYMQYANTPNPNVPAAHAGPATPVLGD